MFWQIVKPVSTTSRYSGSLALLCGSVQGGSVIKELVIVPPGLKGDLPEVLCPGPLCEDSGWVDADCEDPHCATAKDLPPSPNPGLHILVPACGYLGSLKRK